MTRISETGIGSVKVTSLRDGELVIPAEALLNMSESDEKFIASEPEKAGQTNINAYLVQNGEKTLLVDAGARELFGPDCGFLEDALKEAGVGAEDVTDLFFTHMHPDHDAGAIDANGKAKFPNATLKVSTEDYNFWTGGNFENAEINGSDWAGLAQTVFSAYDGRIETLAPDAEIIKGVTMLNLPGHTPGHAGFRIESGGEMFAHLGDIFHLPNLQLANPDISIAFDIDVETARKTRKATFEMICADKILCAGGHMVTPRFGHLEKDGNGFRLV